MYTIKKYQENYTHIKSAFNILQSSLLLELHILFSIVSIDGNIPGTPFLRYWTAALSHFLRLSHLIEILFLDINIWRNKVRNLENSGYIVVFEPGESCTLQKTAAEAIVTGRTSLVLWDNNILHNFLAFTSINRGIEQEHYTLVCLLDRLQD